MFTLDRRRGDNTIAVAVEIPEGGMHTVLLDFQSEYDKQQVFRSLQVESKGKWIVGVMDEDRIPYTGDYTVTIHDTVEDFLSLDEIHVSLDELDQPLDDLRGEARNVIIDVIRAVVYGSDYPFKTQPTEISRSTVQREARGGFTSRNADSTAKTQNTAMDEEFVQANEKDNKYDTYRNEQ